MSCLWRCPERKAACFPAIGARPLERCWQQDTWTSSEASFARCPDRLQKSSATARPGAMQMALRNLSKIEVLRCPIGTSTLHGLEQQWRRFGHHLANDFGKRLAGDRELVGELFQHPQIMRFGF